MQRTYEKNDEEERKQDSQKPTKKYYWKVCNECNCEYGYKLPMCPQCYDEGYECRSYAVKTSNERPPMSVVNYNKPYLTPIIGSDELKEDFTCYDCNVRQQSYCSDFGKVDYYCQNFEFCKCSKCCVAHKRALEKELQKQQEKMAKMAAKRVPINKNIS